MTFLATWIDGDQVLHVSDRLISATSGTGPAVEWEPTANKSLILLSGWGVGIVAYAGLAHLGGKPTDQVIAEILRGAPLEPELMLHGAVPMGGDSRYKPRLHRELHRLTQEIPGRFAAEPATRRRNRLELQMAGLTFQRHSIPRPFARAFVLGERGEESREQIPRHWRFFECGYLLTGGVAATQVRQDAALAALEGVRRQPESIEAALVALLRGVADDNKGLVGKDCIVMWMHRKSLHLIVRYLPVPPVEPLATSYSPWILGPGGVMSPQRISGNGSEMHLGRYSVALHRDPPFPEGMTRWAMDGHARRPLN